MTHHSAAAVVLMVRPSTFGFNEETAATNNFQKRIEGHDIAQTAVQEFDTYVTRLRQRGIEVIVVQDKYDPQCVTPDSIFPNNWFSTHPDGTLVLYPMCTPNRRAERSKNGVLSLLEEKFSIRRQVDLSHLEETNKFLEGTGSLVVDHQHRVAYVALSPRACQEACEKWYSKIGNQIVNDVITFRARDKEGIEVYHTNVILSVGGDMAIVCTEAIVDEDKSPVVDRLRADNKLVIEISLQQAANFAANALIVGDKTLVISQTGWAALSRDQQTQIQSHLGTEPLTADIPIIEQVGGGSARCMLAEIFLPKL